MKEPQNSEPTIAWAEDLEHSGVTKYMPGGSAGPSTLLKQGGSSTDPMQHALQLP